MNQLKINAVLQKILKDVVPTDSEKKKVEAIISFTKNALEAEIAKEKINAEVVLGGSIGKNTWLKGDSDIDLFIRFGEEHQDDRIDERLGKVVKSVFPQTKVAHGSRDYYKVNHKGYEIEFVPVFKIGNPSEAKNSMDVSPFHVKYVKRHSRINNIGDEIRILKAFAKAQGFYGAETYTAGLSGYVAELLIVHYGTFCKLIEAFEDAQPKIIIDTEKQYKNQDLIMKNLSESKLKSPIVLIDPVLKSRNAAAALNYSTFSQMLFSMRMFMRNPNLGFFRKRETSFEKIKKRSKRHGTSLISADIKMQEDVQEPIFLAKLQKRIERVHSQLEKEGIEVYSFGYVNKEGKIKVYFELETLKLSKQYKHYGPPVWVRFENFNEFIKKHKDVYVDHGSLTVDLKRKYADVKKFALSLLKEELKNV